MEKSNSKRVLSGVFGSGSSPSRWENNNEDIRLSPTSRLDEEALQWAAIERLPTNNRARAAIYNNYDEGGRPVRGDVVDVAHLNDLQRHLLIEKLIQDAQTDNEIFLKKLRRRIDRVGIRLPTVEVRFQGLHVQALCHFGTRALPTLLNTVLNILEGAVECFGLKASKKAKLDILDNASGIIRPGRITLLLGPPSCGKTTLLLALAGKLSPDLKTSGSISYNGYELHEFVPQKTSAYISQHDEHIAEMTVRETLDFSARCLGVGVKHDLVTEILRREKEAGILPEADIDTFMKATAIEGLKGNLQTDYILKILGLDICANTIVGNGMIRGISGGQRKRVTSGEMIVSPMKTLFMDEISTGLDSSTTYQIVKCHRQFAHVMEATIVMSLLQPAPETYSLFDDIVLLSEGKIIYNGPRENVLEFFEFCGFKCPERKGTADFLQEVISRKDQEQYWSDKKKPHSYISSEQFSRKFKEFHIGQKLSEELSHPFDKSQNHKAALSFRKYSLDKWQLFKACFNREWLLMKRNSFVYIFKAIQLVVVAFITMTVFLRTHMKVDVVHGNYFLGSLFFSLMVMMFIGQAELVLAISRLPVFFKQRDLFFYPAWAYALPGFLLKIPLSLFDSLIWTAVTYYTIGYSPEPSRFFRQLFVFFAMHQMATSLFRVAAGICRSMVVANTGGSIGIVIVLYLGGFLIPRASIPVWWRWAYWISPLSYAESAITVNEFLAPRWMKPTFQNISLGIEVLENRGLFHDDKFYWIGVISLLGFVLLFNFIYILSLTYLNPIGKRQALISQEKLTQKNEIKDDAISKQTNGSTAGLDHQSQESRKGKAQLSILEDDMQKPVKASGATKGMLLTFQPLSIAFRNIQYFVDMPPAMRKQGVMEKKLHLLKDVTGAFRPGVLTALMGVSGAGKTTLMDVLAGRKTGGYIEGDIMIGGFPKVQETFTRVSGYCEQNDIHSPQVTVHESLLFSAWLRLGNDRDSKTKKIFVSEVMQLVELDVLKDMLVGIPGISGLSTEQRKRLTIAVELVANPSIIFMDEPTSGLDARAAAIVMRAVRNTVDTGRTVVCTIHQPSIEIFESFDELLLMKRGGQIIYAGELGHQSEKIVKYFEAIAGVPKIRDDINPAAWMLEVSSIAVEQRLGIDFARLYTESSLCNKNMELVKELSIPAPGANKVDFPTKYAQSPWKQFTCCLWKLYWAHWRSPGYNLVRFTYTFICAFIFGTIYWQQGTKIHSQKDLLKVLGAMYGGALFLGINNCSSVQAFVDVERMVFYREKGAGMYFPFAFALAQIVAELPYTFFQTIMFVAITYPMIGYYWSLFKFLWYTYITFCSLLYFTYYGMLSVAISPNAQIAAIMSAAFFSLFNLFSGFLITQPQIPRWWVWYYWICPTAWTLDGFITAQYGDVTKSIITQRGLRKSIQQFSKDYFGFHKDFMPVVAVVLAIFPAFFALLFVVTISKLNFQKR